MNIDERLEKLAERHEALTMSVELLTRDVQSLRESLQTLGGIVTKLAEGTASMARVVKSHGNRLDDLEGTV